MLDPIVNFFVRVFQWIGRGIGLLVGVILWPFLWVGRWYAGKGWILRAIVGALIFAFVAFYAYFIWQTQHWANFNPDYSVERAKEKVLAGEPVPAGTGDASASATGGATSPATNVCNRSEIVDVTADLIDFNVNQNAWIPSMLASKLGFFGIAWNHTPFLDNKAAFQLGINQVLRRTTTELVDTLGRARGTSQIDQNLQEARTGLAWDENAWYIGWRGPTRPTPSVYREAERKLRAFNTSLEKCQSTFDARADNLMQFLDRISGDMGSTSDILRARMEASNAGWFDLRADDRFWFAYGQLYAYYGILRGTRADFSAIIQERNLTTLWTRMEEQLRTALNMQPGLISNGNESSALFPSHLANMGFHLLRARSQAIEIRSVLDR
ncbi:DUF2333 family protein [Mesorhizobium sp. NBSH29]|uniref:DUF2333 family protein n=1 Tax=Mesorhizobium sp. NBSH29 TaxID=2654249 RepID=UPI00189691C2|nr:DUF2333 family protein [Mesorhizobium sp. NBSH29]QPC85331.1 DUF2333 family protein [Mesorhizobium sp. NBSH29]